VKDTINCLQIGGRIDFKTEMQAALRAVAG
jgi:hypothetical protein